MLVGLSSAEDRVVDVTSALRWAVVVVVALLAVAAVLLGRLEGGPGAAALGTVTGLAFGAVAVAARILPPVGRATLGADLGALLTDPATYALVGAAAVALLTYSTALQRGTVTQATAPLVVAETVAPALVGLLVLGVTCLAPDGAGWPPWVRAVGRWCGGPRPPRRAGDAAGVTAGSAGPTGDSPRS